MRQVRYYRYGKPEVLQIDEVPVPTPSDTQVLIKVAYVGLNPKDAALRNGFLKQLRNRRFPKLTGFDFSGKIEAIGKQVKGFAIGDKVMGYYENLNGGAAADYLVIQPSHISRISIEERVAATMPCVYLTALQAYQQANLQTGQHVMVFGASGGVGTAAIQLGKYFGAKVTAVSSAKNSDYCLDQGADEFIAYDEIDPFGVQEKYDLFFQVHVISGDRYIEAKKILNPHGKFITLTPNPLRKLGNAFQRKKIYPIVVRAKGSDLSLLNDLTVKGAIRPRIAKETSLAEIAAAHQMIQSQHIAGKIVIRVESE